MQTAISRSLATSQHLLPIFRRAFGSAWSGSDRFPAADRRPAGNTGWPAPQVSAGFHGRGGTSFRGLQESRASRPCGRRSGAVISRLVRGACRDRRRWVPRACHASSAGDKNGCRRRVLDSQRRVDRSRRAIVAARRAVPGRSAAEPSSRAGNACLPGTMVRRQPVRGRRSPGRPIRRRCRTPHCWFHPSR